MHLKERQHSVSVLLELWWFYFLTIHYTVLTETEEAVCGVRLESGASCHVSRVPCRVRGEHI